MACFRIPEGICSDMERLCANFWWGDTDSKKGMHWARWEKLCKTKSDGRVGFRKLAAFNKAMLAKQVWRILKFPNSLLAKVFKGRYFHDSHILDAKKTSNSSFIWRSMCWGRELLMQGLRWKIGDGLTVKAFSDAWIPGIPARAAVQNSEMETRVADFLSSSAGWDVNKLSDAYSPFLVERILSVAVKGVGYDDVCYWSFDEKGRYTVKSGYLCDINFYKPSDFTSSCEAKKWWTCIWSLDVQPKVKHFAWRALNNLIATEENLRRHHVPTNGICFWCGKDWGSTTHCLLFCSTVKAVWKETHFWDIIKGMRTLSLEDLSRAVLDSFGVPGLEEWFTRLWSLWQYLCERKHGDGIEGGVNSIVDGSLLLDNFQQARRALASTQGVLPKEGAKTWFKPRKGILRMDVDVAVLEDGRLVGVGCIVRDHDGKIVAALAQRASAVSTVLMGELHAMLIGIGFCLENDFGPVHLFTDSLLAIHVVQDSHGGSDSLCDDLYEAFAHAKQHVVLDFSHARREANRAAHSLAHFAILHQDVMIWKSDFPSWLLDIVLSDLE